MRQLLFLLLISVFLGCSNDFRIDKNLFYYEKGGNKVYRFRDKKLIVYNFLDSIKESFHYKIQKKNILIENKKFKFKTHNDESIEIIKTDKVLKLIPFNTRQILNDSLLNFSTWYENRKGDKVTRFTRINNKRIEFFFKFEDQVSASFAKNYIFYGKMFQKFDSFLATELLIPIESNIDELKFLVLNDYNLFEEISLKKHFNKTNFFIGKWKQIDKIPFKTKKTIFDYQYLFKSKKDSIKELLNYTDLEFTDKFLFRFTVKDSVLKKNIYDADYSIPGIVFLKNVDFDNQFIKINNFKKDTMLFQFSNPKLDLYYVKDKNGNGTE